MTDTERITVSARNWGDLARLSPFELKDELISEASSDADRLMLNAGRGNPNFLATLPRWAFLSLGEFAMRESQRSYSYLDSGFGGLPEREGIVQRFEAYAAHHEELDGITFLRSAISYVKDQLGLDRDAFLFEMVGAFLGSTYPTPPRMLTHAEEIVKAYIAQEMFGPLKSQGPFSLFATEGGTAAMTYLFQSLAMNGLISPGDKIAIGTPIFSPYLEIPLLQEYDLQIVNIRMDRCTDWQIADGELAKLCDPAIKIFCLVNPSNPPSSKLGDPVLDAIAELIRDQRPDLLIVTDDVYGTFADEFVSLFAKCPNNTVCVYSFSKYFGATGWRLGVIAIHDNNMVDTAIANIPEERKKELDARYATLTARPRELKFIDRLVADSRAVALNHTAGLSVPQQLQMTLFALNGLMDRLSRYRDAAKQLVRQRYQTLYRNIGVSADHQPNDVNYYTLVDLDDLADVLYGEKFKDWFVGQELGIRFLFRLAEETGVVLLPGKGFDVEDTSARVSLANLTDSEYVTIGAFTRQVLDEYHAEFCALDTHPDADQASTVRRPTTAPV